MTSCQNFEIWFLSSFGVRLFFGALSHGVVQVRELHVGIISNSYILSPTLIIAHATPSPLTLLTSGALLTSKMGVAGWGI